MIRHACDVVTGFLAGNQARGRPVGLGIDGSRALLIADGSGITIWLVAADGAKTPARSARISCPE